MPNEELRARALARLADLFERLSNPARLRVLCALADGRAHSLGGLAGIAGVTRNAVSRHLDELRRLGLVTAQRSGADKSFRLHPLVRRADDGLLNLGRGVRVGWCAGDCANQGRSAFPFITVDLRLQAMPHVLIVDDVRDSVEPLALYLERAGYLVKVVTNAQEALAEVVGRTPQVLLLDLHMPERDGAWLLDTLRADLRLTMMPVVVLTGVPDSPLVEKVRAMSIHSVLTKGKATFRDIETALRLARHHVPGTPAPN